jgi:hypothetical protein
MIFSRTEEFFRMFHPKTHESGSIVLRREFGKSFKQSQISTIDLERFSRQAVRLNDVFFSTSAFLGQPLLLNFSHTSCLHLQVPKAEWNTNIILPLRLENLGIPLPTATLYDGIHLTLLWIIDSPIRSHEFYIHTMLQRALYEASKEFNPTASNLDIASTIRMAGSINSKSKQLVGLVNDYGKTYSRGFLQEAILKTTRMSPAETFNMQTQAGIILELMALLGERWFSTSQYPELFSDWIIFIGASLSNFCTPCQLRIELCAVAESLEGLPWKKISSKYEDLILSIINTAQEGYIDFEGVYLPINEPNWRDLISGKLSVTLDEQKYLNLQVLGNQASISPHLHLVNKPQRTIGHTDFIPADTLLLRSA